MGVLIGEGGGGLGEIKFKSGLFLIPQRWITNNAENDIISETNSDEDYFREWYYELSSFSNDLMKIKSFRASRGRGVTWIQTRIKSP